MRFYMECGGRRSPDKSSDSFCPAPYTHLEILSARRDSEARSESRRDEGRLAPGDRTPKGVREPGVKRTWTESPVEGRRAFQRRPFAPQRGSIISSSLPPGSLIPTGFGHPGLSRLRPFGTLLVAPKNGWSPTWFRDTYKVQLLPPHSTQSGFRARIASQGVTS